MPAQLNNQRIRILVLAAGKGSRMQSDLPKVLHTVGGITLIDRVLHSVNAIDSQPFVVLGNAAERIQAHLGNLGDIIMQHEQLGTGHAVRCAQKACEDAQVTHLVVVPSDHPFISRETLETVIAVQCAGTAPLTITTAQVPHFEGEYEEFSRCGRVLRDSAGSVLRIVEAKEATAQEVVVTEVNVSYYCFETAWLWKTLESITADNMAGEYYLTDVVARAIADDRGVNTHTLSDVREGMGVNTKHDLEIAEQCARSM